MADFCKECSIKYFYEDLKDFANLCKEGETINVLCEECGYIIINHLGERVGRPHE